MAKGALAKEVIFNKMLEVFEGSFMYNGGKELRIPFDEEGTQVQIKVALTCAKDNVEPEGGVRRDAAAPSEKDAHEVISENIATVAEPTEEEKKNLEDLMKALGL